MKQKFGKIGKVGIDLDDTLYKLVSPLLERYNAKYQDSLKEKDITDYDIEKFLNPACKNIFKEFCDKELVRSLTIAPKIVQALTELHRVADVYFITATRPVMLHEKHKLLSKEISWYKSKHLISCQDKSLLRMDIMIDDNMDTLRECSANACVGLLIDKPWNTTEYGTAMIKRFYNTVEAIEYATDFYSI